MTTESRAPLAADWGEVVEALHGALNVVTVRGQYPAGHPAVRRADEQAAVGFARVFGRVSELVVALLDGEFIVSERPRPELRERLPGLAEIMVRHEVDCIVFQRGITTAECSAFAEILSAMPDTNDPARARDQAQARLAHVLLRFAELRAQDGSRGTGGAAEYLVPAVHEALADVAGAIARGGTIDRRAVQSVASSIQARCAVRAFSVHPRAYAEGANDLATHATNVATMTAAMAYEAHFPEPVCIELTGAALLHDVGLLLLPASIRGIPEPLLDERARKQYRHHPFLGARALLAGSCPALWVAVALEHHRGVDGGGYPAFGSTAAPHELVRIVSLANYFDDKRAELKGKVDSPPEVLRAASALEKRYFDTKTLGLFIRAFGLFPPGTVVELSDRQAAVVTRANPGHLLRPEVEILSGPSASKHVDLKALNAIERKHELSIVGAIVPPLALRGEAKEGAPPPVQPVAVTLPDLNAIFVAPKVVSMPPEAAARSSRPPAPPPRPVTSPPHVTSRPPVTSPPPIERAIELRHVPKLVLSMGAIMKLPLDPRAGFLLSFIDGASSVETIIDGSGVGQEEALRIFRDLLRHGAIVLT